MMELYEWQLPAFHQVNEALIKYGTAVNASDMGTGKTLITLKSCKAFNVRPIIVCPKAAMLGWRLTCEDQGIEPYMIATWQACTRAGPKVQPFIHPKGRGRNRAFHWNCPDDAWIIFDEVHHAKSHKTLNAWLHMSATRQDLVSISLSATLAESPTDMRAIAYALGLYQSPNDYWAWLPKQGCFRNQWNGYEFNGNPNVLANLNNQIFPDHGARIRKSEIPDFPKTQIFAELVELSPADRKTVNADLKEALMEAIEEGQHAVVNLRLRQITEQAKLSSIIEQAKEGLESGNAVVIGVSFTDSLQKIYKALPMGLGGVITGSQTLTQREQVLTDFKADRLRFVVVQIAAGGVGCDLHDIHGKYPRLVLLCPDYSAYRIKQFLGRVNRAGGKSPSVQKLLYAAGTVEERICEVMQGKLDQLDMLQDGEIDKAVWAAITEAIGG